MAIDSFSEYMDTLSILVETENLYASIEELIRKSNNRGGMDNISIAYLEFSESGD